MAPPTEIKPQTFGLSAGIKIFLLQNLESDKQKQRKFLRQILSQTLTAHQYSAPASLVDLLQLPQHVQLSISLSHCQEYNALAWIPLPAKIGIDIENTSQIKTSTVTRISSLQEQALAPRQDLLWCCKEAVFKTCAERAKVLSFVEIFDWKPLRDETWSFRAREAQSQTELKGTGEVRLILGHCLAFFIVPT